MIVKRKARKRDMARKIVRRSRPVVGTRTASSGGGDFVIGGNRPPRPPQISPAWFAWRPGRGFAFLCVGLLALGVIGGSGYAAYESSYFEVSNVKVQGNQRVETASIVERVDLLGEKMFTADLAEAQRNLYAIPALSSVKVDREWPNSIVVEVEERQPWGTWEQGGVAYTIDREGVVIGGTSTPPPPGSPVIVSSEEGSRQLGDRVDYQAVDAAAQLYELLPRELGTTVSEVAFLTGKGVQVTTGSGEIALLGDSGGINYKLAVWAAVASEAQQEGIAYSVIDLRYGNRPVLQ